MQSIIKYENLQEVVPELLPVLAESIQTDCLEIRRINTTTEKFREVAERFPALKEASYVIYSKFIKKCDHQHETFIFVNKVGHSITHISGRELALYGLLQPCEEFAISQEYANNTAT